jgi:hypothetical protein
MRYLVIKGSDIVNVIEADEAFVARYRNGTHFERSDVGEIGDGWDNGVIPRPRAVQLISDVQDAITKLQDALQILRRL